MHFSTVPQSTVFSKFLGVLVTDLSVGAPPVAEAPSRRGYALALGQSAGTNTDY